MKTWNRLVMVSLLLVAPCYGQSFYKETVIGEPSVPEIVLKEFRSANPTARTRSYLKVEIDGTPFYKIEARDGAAHRYFSYTPSGELKKIEDVIAASELPADAQHAIQEKYPQATISYAEKIIQGDQISYRANAKKDDKLFAVDLDAEGKITSAREVRVTNVFLRARQ